ncbi:hypothetical protein D3C87_1677790 [compost metagenome]
MQDAIGIEGPLPGRRFGPHLAQGLGEPGRTLGRDVLAGQRRGLGFEQPAHGGDFEGRGAELGQGQAAVLAPLHEGADAHAHFHQSGDFECNQRLAHGRARYPQIGRQVAFRGQLPPRFDRALQDLVPDLVGDLDVEFAVGYGLQLHWGSPCPLLPARCASVHWSDHLTA